MRCFPNIRVVQSFTRNRLLASGAVAMSLLVAGAGACGSNSGSGEAHSSPEGGGMVDATSEESQIPEAATDAPADGAPVEAGPACTATPCVTQLGVGGAHSCARIVDGTARCWGSNFAGELGSGIVSDAGFDGGNGAAPGTPTVTGVARVAAGGVGQTD